MAINYTWDCKTVNAYIEKDGNSDVIYCIHYRLIAVSDQKIKMIIFIQLRALARVRLTPMILKILYHLKILQIHGLPPKQKKR